jgi:hypothetical protein
MEQSNDQADKQPQHQQQQQPSPPDEELLHGDENGETFETTEESQVAHSALMASGLSYPPADKEVDKLTMTERRMKVGRSCPCEAPGGTSSSGTDSVATPEETQGPKCDCQGWKPKPPGTAGRADTCVCGHKLSYHGGPWEGVEFERRLRAAVRRDELLQVH